MCPLSGVERFPLFGGFQCTGRGIGTGNNVCYIEVVHSWEGPLIEVPLYMYFHCFVNRGIFEGEFLLGDKA